jgi:hypothetical protein
MLAHHWIEADGKWQMQTFESTQKRPVRLTPPKATEFASEEEFQAALKGRMFLCDDPEHTGHRLLKPGEYNDKGGKTCKQCKARKVKTRNGSARPPSTVYNTAEQFMEANAKFTCETCPELTIGNCPAPKETEFSTTLEYERAVVMRNAHCKEYHKQYKDANKERANKQERERYNAKQETEEGRQQIADKMKTDQENKKARMHAPIQEGKIRCPVGPHDAPREEFLFDPVDDLGLQDYKGLRGKVVRTICKKHFCQSVHRYRRHNSKAE